MADIPDMPPVPCPDCMHPTTFDEDAFVCSSCGQAFAHPHGMVLSQWRELWRAWTAGRTVVQLPETIGDVDVLPTKYEVSILPRDDINRSSWSVTVTYRGNDRWAVVRYSQCLGRDGTWDYEHIPSEREDDWIDAHRFPLGEALRLAVEHAPHVITNGKTAAEILAWIGERASESGVGGGV